MSLRPVTDSKQVVSAKLLGVILKSNFKMNELVDFIISRTHTYHFSVSILSRQTTSILVGCYLFTILNSGLLLIMVVSSRETSTYDHNLRT